MSPFREGSSAQNLKGKVSTGAGLGQSLCAPANPCPTLHWRGFGAEPLCTCHPMPHARWQFATASPFPLRIIAIASKVNLLKTYGNK